MAQRTVWFYGLSGTTISWTPDRDCVIKLASTIANSAVFSFEPELTWAGVAIATSDSVVDRIFLPAQTFACAIEVPKNTTLYCAFSGANSSAFLIVEDSAEI